MFKRNEKASSTFSATINVGMDPNKMDSIQYMIHREALMTLKTIHEILSSMAIESKSHTDIDKESNQYRLTCRLAASMETGKYDIDASIVLTTSTGSITDSNSELVKLVHDIETLCREKG